MNNKDLIKNIIMTIMSFALVYLLYRLTINVIPFDGAWHTIVNILLHIVLLIVILLTIWVKNKKPLFIIIGLTLFLVMSNALYFLKFSPSLEAKLHLHNKYNLDISKMKAYNSSVNSSYNNISRSVTIKYEQWEFEVKYNYKNHTWEDNYNDVAVFKGKK